MIWLFLKQRKSWILFFVVLQLWLNVLFYLDEGLSSISIKYVNIMNSLLFLFFLIWRYFRETSKIHNLNHFLGNQVGIENVIPPNMQGLSPFEERFLSAMAEVYRQSKEQLNRMHVDFSEESDRTLAWIHEVKTPMTAMKLMIDSLEDISMKSKLEIEWLRMHLLLDQELHHIRLSTIENDTMMEVIELREIVLKEIKSLRAWCIEKNIGFDMDMLKGDVLSDPKWVAFMVRQLLSNAVKYSDSHSEIVITSSINKEGNVFLHIKDEGIGIGKADLPRIFNKSFTGTTGRQQTASTGMGLYLAKNVANQLGIQISVQSKQEKGSVFSLRFPLKNEFVKIMRR